ncbi:MAG TPA: glycosyltransferase family 4 protein, partial [Longimicrobiales bacterium]|nr:glycosyltransferase family 4 protein [Longimicrobiales bacterium]
SVYLPGLRPLPVVCGHHNVESALLARRAEAEPSRVRRAYLRLQSRLQETEERTAAPSVALNLVCSEEDRAELSRIAPGARIAVVSNGVDTGQFQPATGGSEGIVFVGGVSWLPNADGMRWFMEKVLPLVRRELPDVPVTWVGRASDENAAQYRERHGVTLTGYVEDIRPYVARAACFVAPIRVGGGTRLKVLDAWAMGKAVVSTSVGCEGLDARDGENILVRNDPGDFAAAVVRVLRDAGMRRALGSAARETAVALYDWGVIGHGMIEEYRRVLATTRAG